MRGRVHLNKIQIVSVAVVATLTVIPIVSDKLQIQFSGTLGRWWFLYALLIHAPGTGLGKAVGLQHGETPWAWIGLMLVVNSALGFAVGTFLSLFLRRTQDT